jgi:hypothetical protein
MAYHHKKVILLLSLFMSVMIDIVEEVIFSFISPYPRSITSTVEPLNLCSLEPINGTKPNTCNY